MSADDLNVTCSSRICSLSHDSLHILLSASLREHYRQKNSHRFNPVGCNIVAGDVNGKAAYFTYRRRNRVG